MTTQNVTYTSSGTYTIPAHLLTGGVKATLRGAAGTASTTGGIPGYGGVVTIVLVGTAGEVLKVKVPYGAGGAGGNNHYGKAGGNGGAAAAITKSNTTLIAVAGGGGGCGCGPGGSGGTPGQGGNGGYTATNGSPQPQGGRAASGSTPGRYGTGEGAGGGTSGSGAIGGLGSTAAGNHTYACGGGGGGGYAGGGGGGGCVTQAGGGGGGGTSFATGVASVAYFTGANATPTPSVQIQARYEDPPLATTLISPVNTWWTAAAPIDFTFKYNPGTDSGVLMAVCMRIKKAGGSYEYWNIATNKLQTTAVWNTVAATTTTIAIPANKLTNTATYNYSIACQEEGTYNLQGPFPNDVTFYTAAMPTVTNVAPSGNVQIITPTVTWTDTIPGGKTQGYYRVCVYTHSETVSPGFTAGVSPAVYDTGVVKSSATYAVLPKSAGLLNGGEYVAYVMIVETTGVSSAFASAIFTIDLDPPRKPKLLASTGVDPVTGCPRTILSVFTNDNLLSANASTFETGLGTWTQSGGTGTWTLSTSTTWKYDMLHSMKVVCKAAGKPELVSPLVTLTQQTSATVMTLKAAFNTKGIWTGAVAFYKSTGALISTVTAFSRTGGTGTGVRSGTATIPSGAAKAKVVLTTPTTSWTVTKTEYVDAIGLFMGNVNSTATGWTTTWSVGGYVGSSKVQIQYSDDGGTTWGTVFGATATTPPAVTGTIQQATVYDYLQPFGQARQYRARITGVLYSSPTSSAWSTVTSTTISSNQWWIIDPTKPEGGTVTVGTTQTLPNPGAFVAHIQNDPFQSQSDETQGVFYPFGAKYPILVSDVVHGDVLPVNFLTTSATEYDNLVNCRALQRTFALKSPFTPRVWYFRFYGITAPTPTSAYWKESLETLDARTPMRSITCTLIEQPVP